MTSVSIFDARSAIRQGIDLIIQKATSSQPALGAAVLQLQDKFFVPEVESDLANNWPDLRLMKCEIPYLIALDKNPHRRFLGIIYKAINSAEMSRGTSSKLAEKVILNSLNSLRYVFLIDFAERVDCKSIDFLIHSEVKTPFILLGRSERLWQNLAALNGSVTRITY